MGLFGVALAAMALPFGPWWPMVSLVVISLTTPAFNVMIDVAVARRVPQAMLGRMDAVFGFPSRALAPFGPVLGGLLASALGGAASLVLIGGLLVLAALGCAAGADLRRLTIDR